MNMINFEIDPSQNYLEKTPHPLGTFFSPKTVAVIGAKEEVGSVGRTVLSNLIATFKGKIFPVNPKHKTVLGLKSYPKIQDIPEQVDLVVIITPAKLIPSLIDDCVAAKVPSCVIISAGFKEIGPEGEALEQDVLKRAKAGKMRIIGPNCLGIMNPLLGLNATFAAGIALPGNLAFISQSGALCTAVLDWSLKEKIGFSSFVSIGSMSDVQWGDLIDYFDHDEKTQSILIYMETVGNARAFLSAAREVVFHKPVILIKPGRTAAAAKAAASHTGSLAGADDVFDTAVARVGILRVDRIEELFNMAEVLSKQPMPKGPRLAIVTNAGGPAVLATDATLLSGAKLAELSSETFKSLDQFLPSAWSHNNPVDVLGDADAERYQKAIDIVIKDPNVDGLLVILTPQDMTESTATAAAFAPLGKQKEKPLLASWMGASHVEEGVHLLNEAGIPTFSYPDSACHQFATLWKHADHLKLLYETPAIRDEPSNGKDTQIEALFAGLKNENRTLLTEDESKMLLSLCGIPVVETLFARTKKEAVQIADKIGYPVVVKLRSTTITHKSDVGGVKLDLRSAEAVEEAFDQIQKGVPSADFQGVTVQKMIKRSGFELILGSMVDPQFGPVVLFGTGGELVEVFKDKALSLPPLTSVLATRMIERTKIYEALKGVRGKKSVDLAKLEEIIIRFSRLIVKHARIKECDINPLLAGDQMIALDARVVLHDFAIPDEKLPLPAIRPYPVQYISKAALKNGKEVILRPVRPEDEPLLASFHKELSTETVRQRYFGFVALEERIAHERLVKICHTDYDREFLLAACLQDQIVGACRLTRLYGGNDAELKMVIIDRVQQQGLGRKLLEHTLWIAAQEKIERVYAHILDENTVMIELCKRLGFHTSPSTQNPKIIVAMAQIRHR